MSTLDIRKVLHHWEYYRKPETLLIILYLLTKERQFPDILLTHGSAFWADVFQNVSLTNNLLSI